MSELAADARPRWERFNRGKLEEQEMRKIIAAAFVSLDGVMQAPGGPEEDPTGGFEYGGWLPAFWDDELSAALDKNFAAPFDLLLGRRTYDIFAAHWPHIQVDPSASDFDALNADIANTFNRITKYVATHRPETLDWQNSESLGADIVATLRKLKQGDGPDLMTQGSSELLRILFENDLVDELRVFTFPLLLGKGKRMFGNASAPHTLTLASSSISPNGVVIATYERAGAVQTGSFALETPTEAEVERRNTLA
jgi:dihydrofolate reductase